jgi:hypothetical protein
VHQSAGSAITDNAAQKIAYFNKIGLHYNLVADAIYRVRQTCEDPFSNAYLPYIVSGLKSFDMTRMMGKDPIGCYDKNANGFMAYLEKKLRFY